MKSLSLYQVKLVKDTTVEYESVKSSCEAAALFRRLIGFEPAEEYLYCIGLNAAGDAICAFEISHGDVTSSIAHPREFFKRLILSNSNSFLISHNHPSDSLHFSREDILFTRRLKECGELLGIKLVDHILLTSTDYASATAQGLI